MSTAGSWRRVSPWSASGLVLSSRTERRRRTAARAREIAARYTETVLIYDADCGFCQRCLTAGRRLLQWTPRAVGFQQADLARYGVTRERASEAIQLCRPGRPTEEGAAAIAAILCAQPGVAWRIAGYALATPPLREIAAAGYRLVARNRRRLAGSACAAP